MENKTYLGDGAYAEFDGYGFWLTTENGIAVTNRIYLEPGVFKALTAFVDKSLPRRAPKCTCSEARRAIGEHREGCPERE